MLSCDGDSIVRNTPHVLSWRMSDVVLSAGSPNACPEEISFFNEIVRRERLRVPAARRRSVRGGGNMVDGEREIARVSVSGEGACGRMALLDDGSEK